MKNKDKVKKNSPFLPFLLRLNLFPSFPSPPTFSPSQVAQGDGNRVSPWQLVSAAPASSHFYCSMGSPWAAASSGSAASLMGSAVSYGASVAEKDENSWQWPSHRGALQQPMARTSPGKPSTAVVDGDQTAR